MSNTAGCSGEIAVGTTARTGPDIQCGMVWFSALKGNTGHVYIGFNEDAPIELPDGVDGVVCGYELIKGDKLNALPIANLNLLDFIAVNDGESVTYIAVR